MKLISNLFDVENDTTSSKNAVTDKNNRIDVAFQLIFGLFELQQRIKGGKIDVTSGVSFQKDDTFTNTSFSIGKYKINMRNESKMRVFLTNNTISEDVDVDDMRADAFSIGSYLETIFGNVIDNKTDKDWKLLISTLKNADKYDGKYGAMCFLCSPLFANLYPNYIIVKPEKDEATFAFAKPQIDSKFDRMFSTQKNKDTQKGAKDAAAAEVAKQKATEALNAAKDALGAANKAKGSAAIDMNIARDTAALQKIIKDMDVIIATEFVKQANEKINAAGTLSGEANKILESAKAKLLDATTAAKEAIAEATETKTKAENQLQELSKPPPPPPQQTPPPPSTTVTPSPKPTSNTDDKKKGSVTVTTGGTQKTFAEMYVDEIKNLTNVNRLYFPDKLPEKTPLSEKRVAKFKGAYDLLKKTTVLTEEENIDMLTALINAAVDEEE